MHTPEDIKKARNTLNLQLKTLLGGIWQPGSPDTPGSGCLIVRLPKVRKMVISNPLALRALCWALIELGWVDWKPANEAAEELDRAEDARFGSCFHSLDTSGERDMWGREEDNPTESDNSLKRFVVNINDTLFRSGNDAVEALEAALHVLKRYEASLEEKEPVWELA